MTNISDLLLRIRGDDSDGDRTLTGFAAKLTAFGKTKATAEADVDIEGQDDLTEMVAALELLNHTKAKPKVEAQGVASSLAGFAAVTAAVDLLDKKNADIALQIDGLDVVGQVAAAFASVSDKELDLDVNVKAAPAIAALAAVQAAATALDSEDVDIDVNVDRRGEARQAITSIAGGLTKLAGTGLGNLNSLIERGGESFANLGEKIGGVTANIGPFGVKLSSTVVLLGIFAGVMAGSVAGAALLMVSALAQAAAGVALLANAFIASLGPALVLGIAAFTQIAAIIKAVKDLETSGASAARKSAEGTKAAATAEEQRHQALIGLRDALQAVGTAQRGLQDAEDQAKTNIANAYDAAASAARDLEDANRNLKDTTVDAYDAIAAAAERASDAVRDVQHAQDGIEQSKINTEKAKLALDKFRESAGLAGKDFNAAFNKFQDVDFTGSVGGEVAKAGGSLGKKDQLDLRQLVLNLKEAKLDEKDATDRLSDSTKNLNDARKDEAKFLKDGINAYKPYTDAIRRQRDASKAAGDAARALAKIEKDGIAGAPGVIAAREALANAEERVAEARRRVKTPVVGIADDAAKARQEFDALPPAAQRLAGALLLARKQLKGFAGDISGGVLNGLTGVALILPGILNALKAPLKNFGNIVGQVFVAIALAFADPKMIASLTQLINFTSKLAAVMGGRVFIAFLKIILNLANAAFPFLLIVVNKLANYLEKLAEKTSDTDKLGASFQGIFDIMSSVGRLIVALGSVFINFFKATGSESGSLIDDLAGAAQAFADFLGSDEGRKEVQNFFKDIIPLAKETAKFVINVIILIGRIIQILAPAFAGVLHIINILIGGINKILGVMRPFLQLAVKIGLYLRGGFVGSIGKVILRFGALKALFPTLFDGLRKAAESVAGFLHDTFFNIVKFIEDRFRGLRKFLFSLPKQFYNAGKAIITGLANGIKAVGGLPKKLLGKAIGGIGSLLPGSEPKDKSSPLYGLKRRGAAILTNMAEGLPVGAAKLSTELHANLVPAVSAIDTSVHVPRAKATTTGGSGGGGDNHFHNVFQITTPNGQLPDANTLAVAAARAMEKRFGGDVRQGSS